MLCCIYGETSIAKMQQELEQKLLIRLERNKQEEPKKIEERKQKLQQESLKVVREIDRLYKENPVRKSKARTLFLTCNDISMYEKEENLKQLTSKLDRKTYLKTLIEHAIKNYSLRVFEHENNEAFDQTELDIYIEKFLSTSTYDVPNFIEGILSSPRLINQLEMASNEEYLKGDSSISQKYNLFLRGKKTNLSEKVKRAMKSIDENFENNPNYLGKYTNKKVDLKKDAAFILDCAEYYIQMNCKIEEERKITTK